MYSYKIGRLHLKNKLWEKEKNAGLPALCTSFPASFSKAFTLRVVKTRACVVKGYYTKNLPLEKNLHTEMFQYFVQ